MNQLIRICHNVDIADFILTELKGQQHKKLQQQHKHERGEQSEQVQLRQQTSHVYGREMGSD